MGILWNFLMRKELAVADLGSLILHSGVSSAGALAKGAYAGMQHNLTVEFSFFYLHMADRYICPLVNEQRRDKLITTMGVPIIEFLAYKNNSSRVDDRLQINKENMLKISNLRSRQYSACQGDNLLAKLAENVASHLKGKPNDPAFAENMEEVVTEKLSELYKAIQKAKRKLR
jgi:hypothetical protein